jgi:hypothetical protein
MFRVTSRLVKIKPFQLQQRFGSGPAALSVQQIETRILELLKNYDKVPQEKVLFF